MLFWSMKDWSLEPRGRTQFCIHCSWSEHRQHLPWHWFKLRLWGSVLTEERCCMCKHRRDKEIKKWGQFSTVTFGFESYLYTRYKKASVWNSVLSLYQTCKIRIILFISSSVGLSSSSLHNKQFWERGIRSSCRPLRDLKGIVGV